jgi:hypothetical protein
VVLYLPDFGRGTPHPIAWWVETGRSSSLERPWTPSELILLVREMLGTHVMYIALPPAVLRHGACCLVAEQQTLKSSLHQCTSQIIVRIHYVLSFCTTTIVVLVIVL